MNYRRIKFGDLFFFLVLVGLIAWTFYLMLER